MDFSNKTILVIGMARSGIATAKVLRSLGATIIVNDSKPAEKLEGLEELQGEGYILALGEAAEKYVDMADLIVVSPSVPLNLPYAQKAKEQGKEVIAEFELAFRICKAPCIAITGTNGKTTTTTLTGQIFADACRSHYVVGNIGYPYILKALQAKEDDMMVAEISSYQLEGIVNFRPKLAALLNITEDHMNRHKTMENYIDAKMRIFENQNESDFAVLNYDDPTVRAMAAKIKSKVLFFSRTTKLAEGAFVEDGQIVFNFGALNQVVCPCEDVLIKGKHNLENALCATALGMLSGISAASIAYTLRNFKGVEHRIETVREINGIRFINDSKGTNPDSTIKAIEAMDRPTVLILGGYDKGASFESVFAAFTPFIEHTVLLGETADKLAADAEKVGYKNYTVVRDGFEAAVLEAFSKAKTSSLAKTSSHTRSGGNVLLSPACASFDMFVDFEHRGEVFKQIVNSIKE